MASIIDRLLGRNRSASSAKERLQLVLIHDRSNLAPGVLESLRDEIVEVISRHVDIDPSGVRLEMEKDGRQHRLVADIPLRTHRRR
jgi:cell division topological specificity factor